jgi:hypothetical protein
MVADGLMRLSWSARKAMGFSVLRQWSKGPKRHGQDALLNEYIKPVDGLCRWQLGFKAALLHPGYGRFH